MLTLLQAEPYLQPYVPPYWSKTHDMMDPSLPQVILEQILTT